MRRNCQIFYIKERWVHFENFERRMTQDEKKRILTHLNRTGRVVW